MHKSVGALLLLVMLGIGACGGAAKPPMQPDSDNPLASLGDGGAPEPASSAK